MIKIMLGSIPHQKLSFYHLPTRGRAGIKLGDADTFSVVSIIFDCSMPIFYNFYVLLATFYTIFGTNILIQCPVLVPVCCMFFCFTENPYQTESKRDKNRRRLFWNICEFWEVESTRDDALGGHEAGGRAPDPRGHPVRRLLPFFRRKKANIRRKIMFKVSIQSELRISGNIRKVKGQNLKRGNRER